MEHYLDFTFMHEFCISFSDGISEAIKLCSSYFGKFWPVILLPAFIVPAIQLVRIICMTDEDEKE